MKRRLLLIDLALVALTGMAGWHLHRQWLETRAREQAVLRRRIPPAPPAPAAAPRDPAPLAAASYNDIAQKMLFSKDRNPVVAVETAPVPPPPPMPPLPLFRGVMNLGDGPVAILSEGAKMPNREFRIGQQVGEFKLLAIGASEIELEWRGQRVTRNIEELKLRDDYRAEAAASVRTEASPPAAAPSSAVPQTGPGVEIGNGLKACGKDDPTPPGAVVDGLRKVVTSNVFGTSCRWEPVR